MAESDTSASATAAPHPPIIIVKKKGGHAAHHGGAWKVAYADFVTAMMALFIVLWLLNTSQDTQKMIGGYFMDPAGKGKEQGSGMRSSGSTVSLKKDDMPKLKEKIEQAMKEMPQMQALKSQVRLIVTGEGLRIELLENKEGTFFGSGSAAPTEKCREILGMLAKQLGTLSNKLLVEGHTDSHPFASDRTYTNWELSADRANAARRLMEGGGLKDDQVAQVRGFADQNLLLPKDPENASNRRVSVIVQYTASAVPMPEPTKSHGTPGGKPGEHQESRPKAATSEKSSH
jgi:chemotaxis protein MotB